MGMIVPSGIYTDKGTTHLRELFLDHCDWQWLFCFENRDSIFDIHRSFKFCPLIVKKGGTTKAIRAAFMHRNVDDWALADRHVLAYPRERVLEFSPSSRAILEIRGEKDLLVLQKVYSHGVLLGDQSARGWGVAYATEFHMTSDSKLFAPRARWESQGFIQDEYGHWLKGAWRPHSGESNILNREPGQVLSRDGAKSLQVNEIEATALPLMQGVAIWQFDTCAKEYLSGANHRAKWTAGAFSECRLPSPQFLMDATEYARSAKAVCGSNFVFRAVQNAANQRTFIASLSPRCPTGNSLAILQVGRWRNELIARCNAFLSDYALRPRMSQANLNWFVVAEMPVLSIQDPKIEKFISSAVKALLFIGKTHAGEWTERAATSWRRSWAVTPHERVRVRAMLDAVIASSMGLDLQDYKWVLREVDYPAALLADRRFCDDLDTKGFWRVHRESDPELRHTVLSLLAFSELERLGIDEFLVQNDGDGWLVPETVRLSDYGLRHDSRAKLHQPVASRLGPRFHVWQLEEDVERSWAECAAHAELIRQIVPLQYQTDEELDPGLIATEETATYTQKGLF